MKKLELNQMESLQGGGSISSAFICGASIGFGTVLGAFLGGPAGAAYGLVAGASVGCAQDAH
ncbi:hypothetical protein SAMN04489761_3249 [Tenacibaculum sp. MAR_2009_124]|uniref:hypothetical protein n=1 Tax=Tenacibaculum sp. MAR_2009_124 TaxID=1250059 RepID=UPI000897B21C|nr:hypothetical protein [Tenacibaculum sp. MAR_2009_124]SEC53266.1 hypothetical protein SAMN04489761_3249 [Tenacibaculum sp. MAR_2009_124]